MKRVLSASLKRGLPLGLALLLCAAGAGAQMFKWTDAKGVVHFSDQPPPAAAGKVEQKRMAGAGAGDGVALPYALAEASRNSPVVLYSSAACAACDEGRALLLQRGIPFTEKTVASNADQRMLKEAGSDGQVPLLLIGGARQIGFEAGAWHAALSEAAYPLKRMLPAAYRQPAAAPAAPVAPPPARDAMPKRPAEPARPPQPASDAPPGFQF
ncbi:MAG: glutaredoxin family protein [Pseudomonadota bacterium]|nr:glutaredoxin family protein [Pseudomonadota bacterium]